MRNAMHITASVFINDNESGLHDDYEVWLEKLAPHAPTSQYHHNHTGEDNADATSTDLLLTTSSPVLTPKNSVPSVNLCALCVTPPSSSNPQRTHSALFRPLTPPSALIRDLEIPFALSCLSGKFPAPLEENLFGSCERPQIIVPRVRGAAITTSN
jgi:hypothetical protein